MDDAVLKAKLPDHQKKSQPTSENNGDNIILYGNGGYCRKCDVLPCFIIVGVNEAAYYLPFLHTLTSTRGHST